MTNDSNNGNEPQMTGGEQGAVMMGIFRERAAAYGMSVERYMQLFLEQLEGELGPDGETAVKP